MENLKNICQKFHTEGSIKEITPLGKGHINDSFMVRTGEGTPDYVLQKINHNIFTDVELLQSNIVAVTDHLRKKLAAQGETGLERRVLKFVEADNGKTYYHDGESFWRMSVFIGGSFSHDVISPEYARYAGLAFGDFQNMLSDFEGELGETIPDFHNMEFRLRQFRHAVAEDRAGRVAENAHLIEEIEKRADDMCFAERMFREGTLPKRICHCDTKVNNILFDADGKILCVVDLDTVMPSFVFSDYGDFLRSAANTGAEDDQELSNVGFDMDIFRSFTDGYLQSACSFLSPAETDNLHRAVALFPYMQTVRFFADHLNGDTYYKINYPGHNLVRTNAQLKLLRSIEDRTEEIREFIRSAASR